MTGVDKAVVRVANRLEEVIPALTGDADRSGFDVLIDAVLPEQASALKKELQASLDPANPSGNTFLISLK